MKDNQIQNTKKQKVLMCGNEAIGEAAIQAGCQFYAGYPITPQNELTAYMSKRMPELNRIFIQSESEIAAINMLFGASAAGARAMTSSSSPGISLKQEGISYMAAARLPGVIVNMMRGGPGLGNISPSQADYFQSTKGGGHGDYHIIVLCPSSVQELFDLGLKSFDLADRYRIPVMILGDGMLGQMMEPIYFISNTDFSYTKRQNEIRISNKPWALTGCKGREPNSIKSLHLGDCVLEKLNKKLQSVYNEISCNEIMFEKILAEDADVIIVAYGMMARICKSVINYLRENNIKAGLLRPISLWPFPKEEIKKIAKENKKILVVEMNSGQMLEDVQLAAEGKSEINFYGRMGGEIPEEDEIFKKVKRMVNG